MEKKIFLWCFFSICMLLNGCSIRYTNSGTPLTRMIITQRGEKSIVVVDLNSTMDIRSYDVPFTHTVNANVAPNVEIHPWGTVGFVEHSGELYRINLDSGELVPSTVDSEISLNPMKAMPNGLYVVGFNVSLDQVVSQGTITDALSTWSMPVRRIFYDIAVCDDNETILVASGSIGSPHRTYITKLNIGGAGEFTDSEREMELPAGNTVYRIACAAGSSAGVAMTSNNLNLISFTIDSGAGIEQVDTQSAIVNGPTTGSPAVWAIAFSPDGTELYARLYNTDLRESWIEKFSFDPSTGRITTTSDWIATEGVPYLQYTTHCPLMVMDPEGDLIYISDTNNSDINLIKTSDGSKMDDEIEDPLISSPENISVGRVYCFDPNGYGCDD